MKNISRAKRVARYDRMTFAVAVMTACALVALILVGAGVTTTGAGMVFPDWPTSNGHLLDPPGWTKSSSTLFEHGHRLIGWAVGMLAILLAMRCWKLGGRYRAIGIATLLAIAIQGALGGLRVIKISTSLAMVHGLWGQLCFCLAWIAVLLTSRSWIEGAGRIRARSLRFFRRGCVVALVSVVIQLVLGASYRHFDSRYALVAHVLWAVWLLMLLGWMSFWILGEYSQDPILGMLGRVLAGLLVAQLFLGGGAFVVVAMGAKWSPFVMWAVPSAHVLVGAAILACIVMTTLCSYHLLRPVGDAKEHEMTASCPPRTA